MSNKPQKLELTWIGKDEQPRPEPGILIEDPERSYGHIHSPSQEGKQGKSTEKYYIFTTTNFITVEFLDKIHEEMRADESLLICSKSFSKPCGNRYPNITVRKIPNMLFGRCEFGKTEITTQSSGKPWKYILIPHNAVQANISFETLTRKYE